MFELKKKNPIVLYKCFLNDLVDGSAFSRRPSQSKILSAFRNIALKHLIFLHSMHYMYLVHVPPWFGQKFSAQAP